MVQSTEFRVQSTTAARCVFFCQRDYTDYTVGYAGQKICSICSICLILLTFFYYQRDYTDYTVDYAHCSLSIQSFPFTT